jgi:hypothetical protein
MLKFFGIIALFFIFIGLMFGFSIFRFFFKRMYGTSKQSRKQTNASTRDKQKQSQNQPKKKKIIEPSEGEYVDYEEVKD